MVNRVVAHLGGRPPYPLHRLDSPTSGVLLFAKSVVSARHVQYQFRTRTTRKAYLAVLLGSGMDDCFTVDQPIAMHPENRTLSLIVTDEVRAAFPSLKASGGKASLTHFNVLARGERAAACAVHPVTGRMHQIRVHAEHVGHPLAGDTQYGLAAQPTLPSCNRLLLHAHSLRVLHPTQHKLVTFTAPPPIAFVEEAVALGISVADMSALVGAAKADSVAWEEPEAADER